MLIQNFQHPPLPSVRICNLRQFFIQLLYQYLGQIDEGFKIVKGYSQLTTQFPIMPGKKELRAKLLADKKTAKILGGQVISGEPVTTLIDLISFAIQKEATVYDLIDLSYSAQHYQSFLPAGNAIVIAAEQTANQIENI